MHPETDEILKKLVAHRRAIKVHGVRRLGLFGSYARGEQRRPSDLDFVVEFERKSFDAYMDLKAYLENLFERRVDLVISDTIKPRLRKTILQEAVHAPGLQGAPRRHAAGCRKDSEPHGRTLEESVQSG
jgi:uncharacterized protein